MFSFFKQEKLENFEIFRSNECHLCQKNSLVHYYVVLN